jgi:uncharacterized small protein (DUF1192 family)
MPAKPIIITDESVVNSYGFRVLTDGIDLSLFSKNPIMLWDHTRREDDDDDQILPIGNWTGMTRQGNQLIATPVFDTDDDFAMKISSKYDKGILNMASIGFDALEWSEDPALMLPGQTLPTVTKCVLKEVSITDIGANPNCCKVSLAGRGTLRLSESTTTDDIKNFFNSNKPNLSMKKVIHALSASKLVNLPEAATEELVAESVTTLVNQLSAKSSKIAELENQIATLRTEVENEKTKLLKDKAIALVDTALSAKKILPAQKDNFIKLASNGEEGYASVKAVLDSLVAFEGVSKHLKSEGGNNPVGKTEEELREEYKKLSRGNGLNKLRASTDPNDKAYLDAIWQAQFGKPFNPQN